MPQSEAKLLFCLVRPICDAFIHLRPDLKGRFSPFTPNLKNWPALCHITESSSSPTPCHDPKIDTDHGIRFALQS